jgi:hypothetical protein
MDPCAGDVDRKTVDRLEGAHCPVGLGFSYRTTTVCICRRRQLNASIKTFSSGHLKGGQPNKFLKTLLRCQIAWGWVVEWALPLWLTSYPASEI